MGDSRGGAGGNPNRAGANRALFPYHHCFLSDHCSSLPPVSTVHFQGRVGGTPLRTPSLTICLLFSCYLSHVHTHVDLSIISLLTANTNFQSYSTLVVSSISFATSEITVIENFPSRNSFCFTCFRFGTSVNI